MGACLLDLMGGWESGGGKKAHHEWPSVFLYVVDRNAEQWAAMWCSPSGLAGWALLRW